MGYQISSTSLIKLVEVLKDTRRQFCLSLLAEQMATISVVSILIKSPLMMILFVLISYIVLLVSMALIRKQFLLLFKHLST